MLGEFAQEFAQEIAWEIAQEFAWELAQEIARGIAQKCILDQNSRLPTPLKFGSPVLRVEN